MKEHYSQVLQNIVVSVGAGMLTMIFASRWKIPAIALLLFVGFLLGPEVTGVLDPGVFGDGLKLFITIAVAIILFEGALSLDHRGLKSVGSTIWLLLSVGVIITWLTVSAAVYFLFHFHWNFALLAGSMVIVTGPTVVIPLLRRLKVTRSVHHVLHWESVLIDPIGVFLSIFCLGLVNVENESTLLIIGESLWRVIIGTGAGVLVGFLLRLFLKRSLIPESQLNSAVITAAIVAFGAGCLVVSDAGLLAVVVLGFVLGKNVDQSIKKIRVFTEEMAEFLIGSLFVVLAAALKFDSVERFGYRGLVLLGVVVFISRPLTVFVSSIGSKLSLKEKFFISWVAPRGIVAASMATLFAVQLSSGGNPDGWFLKIFVFSVVVCTVPLYSFSAGFVASRLGVLRVQPRGWLIVGAHELSTQLSEFLKVHARADVIIIDSNRKNCSFVKKKGLEVLEGDALDDELLDDERLIGIGNVFALTDNEALNSLICRHWADVVGKNHVFRWGSGRDVTGISGRAVWQQVPRPGVISADILRGQARVAFEVCNTFTVSERAYPLVSVKNLDVILTGKDTVHTTSMGMVLLRELTYLHRLTRPDLIHAVDCGDIGDVLRKALEAICVHFPVLQKEETFQELLQREERFPTSIGDGIAVPHSYSSRITSTLMAIVQTPHGIEWGAFDQKPVTLVFVLISPAGDPERHLSTLSCVAQLVNDPEFLEQIKNAQTPDILYKKIQAREIALAY
ncbi:MAG: cation:proton antiporter [Chitinispirillaceae bacterium]|nr:cation:proton antiporter [Chitinispirillaceae bacterium]